MGLYPDGDGGHFAAGAFAGAGGGVFITNANCAKQLSGPFDTFSINLGYIYKVSFQLGVGSDGTFIASGTLGPGIGINVSGYPTNTGTTQ